MGSEMCIRDRYHWVAQGAKPPAETLTDGRLIDRRNFEKIAREAGLE